MHNLDKMSLATCKVLRGLDALLIIAPEFGPDSSNLGSCSCFSRICLTIPTKSSSTLCWIPAEVSMNLASHEAAIRFPSVLQEKGRFNGANLVVN